MREGEPSRTAAAVAAHRLAAERLAAPYGDPASDERLARDVAGDIQVSSDSGMARYLRARTAVFDRVVLNAQERGVVQVAVIGAGYDGRALRYAKPGVQWFELDHPATQRDKLARLDRLGIDSGELRFVAADLTRDDAAAALIQAGYDPDAPAVVLCEGLVVYLDRAVVVRLFGALRGVAGVGTRLAVSAGIPGRDPRQRAVVAERVAELGEPVRLDVADVPALLEAERWRLVELSERARRIGLNLAAPQWRPGRPKTRGVMGRYLERTFHREGLAELPVHLAREYGITVTGSRPLDVGVVLVRRDDGPDWVARVFPADRPAEIARADVGVLGFLAAAGYPAERSAAAEPLSALHGQAVLVTEFLPGAQWGQTAADYRRLGASLARLHALPDAPARPGGAWHHLADAGGPAAEIAALRELLAARSRVPPDGRVAMTTLLDRVRAIDDLHDLPTAFTHPDFVPANAIVGADGEPVFVDWAGAGVAPRLWSLAFLLWAAGRRGRSHVRAVVSGYGGVGSLGQNELDRLEPALVARPLIFDAWACATGRRALAEVTAGRAELDAHARRVADWARGAVRD